METRVSEIADGIYRLSTYVPDVAPPDGFTFNQFLILAEQPLLFHCGHRALFPSVSSAMAKVMPVERLRWISFGHLEADECGAMNLWLAAAPGAQILFNELGCQLSVSDLADRPPHAVKDGETIDLGGRRVRLIPTPHVPHNWEAQVLYEETTNTLFCGDLFTHVGDGDAITAEEILAPAIAAERLFGATSVGALTAPTIRRLAALKPERLALMHGSSFEGDGETQLLGLADAYDDLLRANAG
jgi:flavorubredoxin